MTGLWISNVHRVNERRFPSSASSYLSWSTAWPVPSSTCLSSTSTARHTCPAFLPHPLISPSHLSSLIPPSVSLPSIPPTRKPSVSFLLPSVPSAPIRINSVSIRIPFAPSHHLSHCVSRTYRSSSSSRIARRPLPASLVTILVLRFTPL
ncbi:hypothetical protein K523DRAFT_150456 [Schizophyllum commune Tattone D]|nr:hypothetical protein K523DRAFT_150456 [Schizophyllum commune Tattone D]